MDVGTWQVGKPTGGPGTAYDGTNCAATGLAGSYNANVDSRLISPFFVVPTADQNPRLRFWHWFTTQLTYDYGEVQIRTNGGSWVTISPAYSGYSGGWTQPSIDLSAYAGQAVQLAFYFHSDGGGQAGGWFVDDVTVVTGAIMTLTPNVPWNF